MLFQETKNASQELQKKKPGHVRPESGFYEKLNALKFVPQQELSREQVYWLPANEIASQASTPATPVTPYVPKSPPPSQVLATLHNIKAVFPQFDAIIKDKLQQIRIVIGEHNKVLDLKLRFPNQKRDTSSASNAIFEINKLRDQLQGKKMPTIRNLDAQIQHIRIQLDGLKVENMSLKRRYDELSKANTHSRCSRHMTGDRARLINFVEKFIGTVRFGNDEYAAIFLAMVIIKKWVDISSLESIMLRLKHNFLSRTVLGWWFEVAFRPAYRVTSRNYASSVESSEFLGFERIGSKNDWLRGFTHGEQYDKETIFVHLVKLGLPLNYP
ncbi:hypothetical protein Tco_0276336 [Tanacetum coccineum]